MNHAEGWKIADLAGDATSGLRHDDFGEVAFVFFLGRIDNFASEEILDAEGDIGIVVDVAGIFDSSADFGFGVEGETWDSGI